jgi:hypothetical protein
MNHFEKQNLIINQFDRSIRNESKREEPNFIESLIEKSRSKTEQWQERLKREKSGKEEIRYSHYRPTHYKTQTL